MEQPSLRIRRETAPTGLVLHLSGEIDVSVAATLDEALQAAMSDEPARVCVNMAGVTFMDSTGLAALVRAHNEFSGNGGRIVVREPSAAVARLLALSGLAELFRDDR